jgi:hypothetical protein
MSSLTKLMLLSLVWSGLNFSFLAGVYAGSKGKYKPINVSITYTRNEKSKPVANTVESEVEEAVTKSPVEKE